MTTEQPYLPLQQGRSKKRAYQRKPQWQLRVAELSLTVYQVGYNSVRQSGGAPIFRSKFAVTAHFFTPFAAFKTPQDRVRSAEEYSGEKKIPRMAYFTGWLFL
ncbi:hypothetical protein J6590_052424 [Homalodisca vitripennis]|nr:hypothetical protein J6590_052424 [Homalodisca vitripennis]